jgi:quinol-cytochrome oxidoreductase complex cytochrome b subunit
MTISLILAPFLIQGLAISFDEFYFHNKRGLGLWERLGHPLDTIALLICYIFIQNYAPTDKNILIFISLCIFSSFLITKDEIVHNQECGPSEQWLHSILFIIHPITLIVLGLIWSNKLIIRKEDLVLFNTFIKGQMIFIGLFLTYQIIYWSIPWKKMITETK